MDVLKRFWMKMGAMFTLPSSEELARMELEEAKRSQLSAMTAQDYARQMVEYHRARIIRLTAYLAKSADQKQEVV